MTDLFFTSSRDNGRRRPRGYAAWRPHARTRALLDQVVSVLEEFHEYLPLTVRQVFYRLVASHGYPKTERDYRNLCEHLVRARRAKVIPFNVLRDDGIVVDRNAYYSDVTAFWDATGRAARDYQRDRLEGQGVRIELWCEAAGMLQQLARTAKGYSVPVYSGGGFNSLSAVRSVVDRAVARPVDTVILHVGDFDPSGEAVFDAFARDIEAFFFADRILASQVVMTKRVALTEEQVEHFQLATAPPKRSDTRSRSWDSDTCQLEALTPVQLAGIVESAIAEWIDGDLFDEQVEQERADRVQSLAALPAPKEPGQ